ncbi:DUF1768-domain-containing protein [Mycena galericulata]|nr:DUF1768-domain-containing protein [Mycena galericulata]
MPSNCPVRRSISPSHLISHVLQSCGNWVQDRWGGNSAPAPSQPRPRILFHPRKTDPYYGFTNVSPHPVKYGGKEYPTSAHLFQAFKYMDNHPDIAERIRTASKSPLKARALSVAYEAQEHPDWVRMRVAKMEIALWHKFSQNAELKTLLLGTGDADIVNYTNQKFWGVGKTLEGSNELGKALERVRKSLRGT